MLPQAQKFRTKFACYCGIDAQEVLRQVIVRILVAQVAHAQPEIDTGDQPPHFAI